MDNLHVEVEIKPELEPRGSVAKEEDPKPSTSCTSCRLNPHDRGRLCLWNNKRSLRAPTRGNALVLMACGHWKQEHTGVGPG